MVMTAVKMVTMVKLASLKSIEPWSRHPGEGRRACGSHERGEERRNQESKRQKARSQSGGLCVIPSETNQCLPRAVSGMVSR